MKYARLLFLTISLLLLTVSATANLDFRLDTPDKLFYPNDNIPLNVTIVNRDATFSAKDAQLTVNIGTRFYTFDLGTLKPGATFQKEIMLPEFPAGTHSIKGVINYTGILDEKFIEESYGSFEVLFPIIERYPRNVYVSNYNLLEKIMSGKPYDVGITIVNDGEINADLLIEFGSINEFFTEKTALKPQETTTVKMTVNFNSSGISLIEARAYALINGEKYLLNYRGRGTYVQDERTAKLSFDKVELVDEADNAINQDDKVRFKILIKNDGDAAADVKGELSSSVDGLTILDKTVSYGAIASKDTFAPSDDTFEIETKGSSKGDHELNLKLNYVDSENRVKKIKVPIPLKEGGDGCTADSGCSEKQTCERGRCVDVSCSCGFVQDRKCLKYDCCSDSDCGEFNACSKEIHRCVQKTGCLEVLYNGASNDKADFLMLLLPI